MKKEYINYRIIADKELLESSVRMKKKDSPKWMPSVTYLTRHPVKAVTA